MRKLCFSETGKKQIGKIMAGLFGADKVSIIVEDVTVARGEERVTTQAGNPQPIPAGGWVRMMRLDPGLGPWLRSRPGPTWRRSVGGARLHRVGSGDWDGLRLHHRQHRRTRFHHEFLAALRALGGSAAAFKGGLHGETAGGAGELVIHGSGELDRAGRELAAPLEIAFGPRYGKHFQQAIFAGTSPGCGRPISPCGRVETRPW